MAVKIPTADRQATSRVWLGLLIQIIATGGLAAVAEYFDSYAAAAVARLAAFGIPIWIALLLLFRQRQRVLAERLESEEIRRARAAGDNAALFDINEEDLLIERRKLEWLARWMLPTVTILLALAMIVGNWVGWEWSYSTVFDGKVFGAAERTHQPQLVMWFVGGLGLICFLFARYAIGLARIREYSLIRAGAAILTGCALFCLVVVLALGLNTAFEWTEPLALYLTRAALFVLGLELLFNFVADFYRPRTPGVVTRPSFDSRLLGLITEPGGIAKSVAEAINYQFGFEVSKTWLYQILRSALMPLTVLTLVAIVGLSSVLMVDADEFAVVERFGEPLREGDSVRRLGPGMHLKLPWPMDIAYRAPVRKLSGILIGEGEQPDKLEFDEKTQAILWTERHKFQAEMMLIVAASDEADLSIRQADEQGQASELLRDRSVAVSLAMASIPVEFRIRDIEAFLYNYASPTVLLESLADRVLTDNAAGIDLETLMGSGREAFNQRLQRDLQREIDAAELGVELVYCGLQSVHPPSEQGVAEAYQSVISAEGQMLTAIHYAEGEAESILTAVAGSRERALSADEAILQFNGLRADAKADPGAMAAAKREVDDLLLGNSERGIKPLSGTAAAMVSQARSNRWYRESQARSKVAAFAAEIAAYTASPDLYRFRKQMTMYENLDGIRKYLVVGDPSRVILEYENVEPTQIKLSEPR